MIAEPATRPRADVRAQPGPVPRGRRPPPVRADAFNHLALDELRAYRDDLSDEETRVSYWRRVLQARIDIVQDGSKSVVDRAALRRLLTTDRVNAGRTALVRIVPADGMPPLPHLAELWDRDPVPGDDDANADLVGRLLDAEHQLSAYRQSLHHRIDAATVELVARYRERPALAVRALPLEPPGRRGPAVAR